MYIKWKNLYRVYNKSINILCNIIKLHEDKENAENVFSKEIIVVSSSLMKHILDIITTYN